MIIFKCITVFYFLLTINGLPNEMINKIEKLDVPPAKPSSLNSSNSRHLEIWSLWSNCDRTCGNRKKFRLRCMGFSSCLEFVICNGRPCPVNGNWAKWNVWNACSKSCGSGQQQRQRQCNNPAPKYNGSNCVGHSYETQSCNYHPCPAFDFISPAELNATVSVNNQQGFQFVCKIFVYTEADWKFSSLKWKYQTDKNAPLIDLPDGALITNNLEMKTSTLKFKDGVSSRHFGHYHCIFDNRKLHPVGVIKGISATIEPKFIRLSDSMNSGVIKCQFHYYNLTFHSNKITWNIQGKNSINLSTEFDSTTNSSIVHIPAGLNESFSGLYQCLYDGEVAATATVEILPIGQSCLESNVQCGFDDDDNSVDLGVCCQGLVCKLVGASVKYCVDNDITA